MIYNESTKVIVIIIIMHLYSAFSIMTSAYLFVDLDVSLIGWSSCCIPAQEFQVLENLFDWIENKQI